jgi:hypothetical protein
MPVFCSSQPHRPYCGRLVAGQRKEGSGAGTNGGAPAELLRAEAVPEARWEPTRQHEAAILAHRRPVNTAITMLPAGIAKKNFNAVSRPVPGTAMGENAGAAARIVPA